jgi:hypothetical protein
MNLKDISFINKVLLGLLGFSIVINIGRGGIDVYRAITDYLSFDYELARSQIEDSQVNVIDAVLSINLITLPCIFIISCFIGYLYFTGRKLFIPLFILNNIYITILTFIINVLGNLGEYEGFRDTIIPLIVTIFWAIYFISSKEIKLLFPNEMKFRKRYVKITEEEYEELKSLR